MNLIIYRQNISIMFFRIQGLSVVISPGGEHLIALALAWTSVGLDLDATNGLMAEKVQR